MFVPLTGLVLPQRRSSRSMSALGPIPCRLRREMVRIPFRSGRPFVGLVLWGLIPTSSNGPPTMASRTSSRWIPIVQVEQGTHEYQPAFSLPYGTLYWRVRAAVASGMISATTEYRRVVIALSGIYASDVTFSDTLSPYLITNDSGPITVNSTSDGAQQSLYGGGLYWSQSDSSMTVLLFSLMPILVAVLRAKIRPVTWSLPTMPVWLF